MKNKWILINSLRVRLVGHGVKKTCTSFPENMYVFPEKHVRDF